MMRAIRRPSAAERTLWRTAMRDAKPFPGKAPPPEPTQAPAPAAASPAAASPTAAPPAARPAPAPLELPVLTYARSPGLDRRSSERLKRGQLRIEARLDLHGMTQEAARGALDRFIESARRRGLRAVLVITGKGAQARPDPDDPWSRPVTGILRRAVPRWLNERPNRGHVLAFTEAQPQHGGAGALYLLLRRDRG